MEARFSVWWRKYVLFHAAMKNFVGGGETKLSNSISYRFANNRRVIDAGKRGGRIKTVSYKSGYFKRGIYVKEILRRRYETI